MASPLRVTSCRSGHAASHGNGRFLEESLAANVVVGSNVRKGAYAGHPSAVGEPVFMRARHLSARIDGFASSVRMRDSSEVPSKNMLGVHKEPKRVMTILDQRRSHDDSHSTGGARRCDPKLLIVGVRLRDPPTRIDEADLRRGDDDSNLRFCRRSCDGHVGRITSGVTHQRACGRRAACARRRAIGPTSPLWSPGSYSSRRPVNARRSRMSPRSD